MIAHTYTEYETIPPDLLRQFRAMRIRRYYTVAALLKLWRSGAPGLVAFIIAPPVAVEGYYAPVLISWCFIIKVPKKRGDRYSDRWHLVSYVRQGWRREGYGKTAVSAATALGDKLWPEGEPYVVYPHDEASLSFMKAKRLMPC